MSVRTCLGALLLAVLALAMPSGASARVMLVATGAPELPFVDVSTNAVIARLALPGPARAIAVSRDGQRGFVAAGGDIVVFDVNTHLELLRATLGPPDITDIALSPAETALYVVQGRRLAVVDPLTLAVTATIPLDGDGTRMAIDAGGRVAAVVLASGRVAIVSLPRKQLLRQVKVKGAVDAAIEADGDTLVTAGGKLRTIVRGQHRARKKAMKLPPGAGGGMALTTGRTKLLVGAAEGGTSAALVDLRQGTVLRLPSAKGPGWPAWNLDASRILIANSGAASVSLVSPFSRARVATIDLPGSAPIDIVVQPGLAPILGTDGNDVLTGTRGPDRIEGLGGDDILRGGRDRDSLDGGPGNDTLSGGAVSDELNGGPGDDFLLGGSGNDLISGGDGNDGADGGTGNDTIYGENGDDSLDGGDGDDTIYGGPGNDSIIEKGFGDDKLLDGGPGDDIINGGRGSDQSIMGDDGNDKLYGESGSERIQGGLGDDYIDGGAAGDRLEGDEGNDTILGGLGKDHLYGGDGDDMLDGGAEADTIDGGLGNDTIIGGSGPDVIDAGFGNDTIRVADDSADIVDCGPDDDTVYVDEAAPTIDTLTNCEHIIPVPAEPDTGPPAPVPIRGTTRNDTLYGSSGDDSIFGRRGNDKLFGKEGNDYVDGDDGNDELHGGPGDDTLAGRGGNDTIYGDDGNDRITGDRGRDTIYGGAGNDTIFGNYDSDTIDGGAGNDRINVVHGGHDVVTCGAGKDIVFADPEDTVAKDCEDVRR